jgi:flagellar basal-body rod protein FlgB
MTHGIENVTRISLGLALDAAVLQQKAITSNIANAGVQGYIPQKVDFSEQLEAARREVSLRGTTTLSTLQNIEPRLRTMPLDNGQWPTVRIDVEMAHLSENMVHYQTLLKGLNRHFSILTSAINEGKK